MCVDLIHDETSSMLDMSGLTPVETSSSLQLHHKGDVNGNYIIDDEVQSDSEGILTPELMHIIVANTTKSRHQW